MITNEERRRVSRNIRQNIAYKRASVRNIALAVGLDTGILVDDMEIWDRLADLIEPEEITGNTSDGYHTFNELYDHRAKLFSVVVRDHRDIAWKSMFHHDGTMYDGMFICGLDTPKGQATYHYDVDPYWDLIDCKELDRAPEWDGHTSQQAIDRIATLGASFKQGEMLPSASECDRRVTDGARTTQHINVSSYDSLPAEDREALRWVHGHGGLNEVRSMFQEADNRRVELCSALGIDHLNTGWSDAMAAMRLRLVPPDMEWPRFEDGDPVRLGDEVVLFGRPQKVEFIQFSDTCLFLESDDNDQQFSVRLAKYDDAEGEQYAPDQLTHERHDSWERLEGDAGKHPFDYCKDVGHKLDTCENSEAYKARDLVRRAKALSQMIPVEGTDMGHTETKEVTYLDGHCVKVGKYVYLMALSKDEAADADIIRSIARDLLASIEGKCHQGRSRSLVITKLEECVMWAVKAIGRRGEA